jgi:hypothetical protein
MAPIARTPKNFCQILIWIFFFIFFLLVAHHK